MTLLTTVVTSTATSTTTLWAVLAEMTNWNVLVLHNTGSRIASTYSRCNSCIQRLQQIVAAGLLPLASYLN